MPDAVDPPHEAPWIFDVERDYRAVRDIGPGMARARAAVEALLAQPGEAAERFVADAVERCDLAATLGGGAVLREHGRLAGDNFDFYTLALRLDGRCAEATALLQHLADRTPDDAVLQLALAEVAGAAGLFARGRAAADRSAALRPRLEAQNLARRQKWVGKLHAASALSWADAPKLVEGALSVGAAAAAVEVLERLATEPPAGDPDFDDLLRLAIKALRLDLPRLAKPMLERLDDARPGDPDVRLAILDCAGRLGHSQAAAQAADAIRASGPAAALADPDTARVRGELRYTLAAAYASVGRSADAVRELDAMVLESDKDPETLGALRRAVGQYVLGQLDLPWAPPRPPKVINLLPYYKERMLFDLRLHEMGDWVDHFVVVEAAESFTGRPKPLHFAQGQGDYAGRGDQVLHVGVERFPDFMRSAWAREFYQRDMAIAALAGVWRPDDIVLITDADEVVDRRAVPAVWPRLANLRMVTSKLFFNYVADPKTSHGNRRSGAVCRADILSRFGSSYVRSHLSATRKRWESIPQAGWHLTSLTDAEGLADKFTDFAHQDDSKAMLRDPGGAGQVLAAVRAGRTEPGWSVRPLDERLPAFVRENRAKLAHLIL